MPTLACVGFQLDIQEITLDLNLGGHREQERVRRGDWLRLDLGFVRNAATIDLGSAPEIVVTVKKSSGAQHFDELATLSTGGFTKVLEHGLVLYKGCVKTLVSS